MTKKTTYFLIVITLVLAIIAYGQGGWPRLNLGLAKGVGTLLSIVPLIMVALLVAGFVQVLITEEFIEKWLGARAGYRGVMLGTLAGALIPGGPYVYYPLALVFLKAGASLGTVISFVSAKNLISITRIPLEVALIGPHITIARLATTWFIPIVLGLVVNRFFAHVKIELMTEGDS